MKTTLKWISRVIDGSETDEIPEGHLYIGKWSNYVVACDEEGRMICGLLNRSGTPCEQINPGLGLSLDDWGFLADPDYTIVRRFAEENGWEAK